MCSSSSDLILSMKQTEKQAKVPREWMHYPRMVLWTVGDGMFTLSSTQVINYGVLATWDTVITRSDRDPWPCGAYILEVQETSNTSNKRIKHTLCIISVYKRGKKRRKVLSPQDDIIWTKTEMKKWTMLVPGLYLGRKNAKCQDASAEGDPESSKRNSKGHIYS